MIWGMIDSKGMENVIDFRKSYGIITAFRCGSTVRDVSAVDFNRTKEKKCKKIDNRECKRVS